MLEIKELLDLTKTIAAPLFEGKTYPWEVLPDIKDFIIEVGNTLPEDELEQRSEKVWVAKDAT
ncbi:MAG: UDP-N-acetylglucosamine pyrophosphorylase, partial [Christensenellales bacterium]